MSFLETNRKRTNLSEKSYERRSSSDPEWAELKRKVDARDKRCCQFEKCLSAKEFYMLKKGTPLNVDRAHIFSAAHFPDLIYEPKNVITLKRYIHRRMDDYESPLNGRPLGVNEHFYWWYRILMKRPIEYDSNTDYELELRKIIWPKDSI